MSLARTALPALVAVAIGLAALVWWGGDEVGTVDPVRMGAPGSPARANPMAPGSIVVPEVGEAQVVKEGVADVVEQPARAEAHVASASPDGRVAGVVLWPDEAPAVGAEVMVRSETYPASPPSGPTQHWKQDGRVVRTGRTGSFAVDELGPGPFALRARLGREGRKWYQVAYEVPAGSESVRLVLRAPVRLSGVVIDDAGRPVVPAEITLAPTGDDAWTRFRSRSTIVIESPVGAFSFADLLAGPYVLRAEAEEHGRSLPLEVAALESATDLVLELERASVVSGFVLDPSGAPAANALIACVAGSTASSESWDLGEVQRDCGEDGSFRLVDLPPGPLTLRAYHADWASSEDVHLVLQPGQQWPGVNVSLRAGGRVTGVVLDDEGRPIVGARVGAESSDRESSRSLESDASGAFVFERLTPGEYQVVARYDDGDESFQALRLAMATVTEGATTHVVIGGARAGAVEISGRVTAGGEPVPDARVIALAEGVDTLAATRMDVCDANGHYELVLPRAGLVTFAVWRAEGAGSAAEFHDRVPKGRAYRRDFQLPAGSIEVTVVAAGGGPAAHVPVAIARDGGVLAATNLFFAPDQRTDGTGRHAFAMLGAGRYTVRAGGADESGRAEFGRALRSGIAVDEETVRVTLELPSAAEVTGVVLDEGGRPFPGALVYVRDGKGQLVDLSPSCYSDAAGRFRYQGVAPGGVSVFARGGDRAAPESAQVTVAAGASTEVELRLSRATLLRVTPVDAEGTPLAASLSLRDGSGRELAGVLTTNDAELALQAGISTTEHVVGPLPPGRYRIEVACADGRRGSRSLELDGDDRELALEVEVR
jgi:hypothetical protein